MNILNNFRNLIFGHDIFISYSRSDSLDYAYAIAQHFLKKKYDCYIDQLSSVTPGERLPPNIEAAIKRSTAFVLIGSDSAQTSQPISEEISHFLTEKKNCPLIPVSIHGAICDKAIWYPKIKGLPFIDDRKENLDSGVPAIGVTERIEHALRFTKKARRLRNSAIVIAIFIFIATLVAGTYARTKTVQAADAIKLAHEAEKRSKMAALSLSKTKDSLTSGQKKLKLLGSTLDSTMLHLKEREVDIKKKNLDLAEKNREIVDKVTEIKNVSKHLDSIQYEEAGLRATSYASDINKQNSAIASVISYIDMVAKPSSSVSPRAWQGLTMTSHSISVQHQISSSISDSSFAFDGSITGTLVGNDTLVIYDSKGHVRIYNTSAKEARKYDLKIRKNYFPKYERTKNYEVISCDRKNFSNQNFFDEYIYVHNTASGESFKLKYDIPMLDVHSFHLHDTCVTIAEDGIIRLWDIPNKTNSAFYRSRELFKHIQVSPSDRYIAVLSATEQAVPSLKSKYERWLEKLMIWDLSLSENKLVLDTVVSTSTARETTVLEFSPDERYLAVGGSGKIDVFEVSSKKHVYTHDFNTPSRAMDNFGYVEWYPGKYDLVFNNGDETQYYILSLNEIPSHLLPYDVDNNNLFRLKDLDHMTWGKFGPDGTFVGIQGNEIVQLRKNLPNYASYKQVNRSNISNNTVNDVFPLNDQKFISLQNSGALFTHTSSKENAYGMPDINAGNITSRWPELSRVLSQEILVDTDHACLQYQVNAIDLISSDTIKHYQFNLPQGPGYHWPLYEYSREGRYLLTLFKGLGKDTALIWDLKSSSTHPSRTFGGHITEINFADSENLLILEQYGRTYDANGLIPAFVKAYLYNIYTSDSSNINLTGALKTFKQNRNIGDFVSTILISGDRYLIVKHEDRKYSVELYEYSTQKLIKILSTSERMPLVSISDKSDHIALALNKNIILFNLSDGEQFNSFAGQSEDISSIIFCMDGSYVLTGGKQGTISMWHAASGIRVNDIKVHGAEVDRLFLLPNDQLLSDSWKDGVISTTISFRDEFKHLCDFIIAQNGLEREKCKCSQHFSYPDFQCK